MLEGNVCQQFPVGTARGLTFLAKWALVLLLAPFAETLEAENVQTVLWETFLLVDYLPVADHTNVVL